jgi:iron(III) transport system substrate-binding protein
MTRFGRGRKQSFRLLPVRLVATLLVACVVASAPAVTIAQTDAWNQTVTAAKAEGSASVLVTEVPGWIETQQNLFKERTGLTMNLLARGANAVLQTRLSAEIQAKAVLTDVYEDVSRQYFNDHLDWFVDLSKAGLPNWDKYPEAARWKNVCADVKWSISGVTYNTNIVTPDIAPKTWQDLVNPRWKDKVVLSDPSPGGYYMQWALMMREKFGPDYLKAVAALNPTAMTSSVGAAQQVASGAKALSFLSQVDSGSDVKAQGGPVAFAIIANPYVGSKACVGIPKAAPHPNAAKVLLNFLMSAESQSAPCRKNIPNVSPIRAPGCYETPADFQPPAVNDKGIYPGMDNEALMAQALRELGLK